MKLLITQAELLQRFQRDLPDLKEVIIDGMSPASTSPSINTFNPNILPISIGVHLKAGNLIGAVKEARGLYSLGLKEAKEYCEMYMYRPPGY